MNDPPNVATALRDAAARLTPASDTARLDAELLMAHALGCPRGEMLLRRMCDPLPHAFASLVGRRLRHEPVAYITGVQEFYGLALRVTPDVLIPRADSEVLIEAARAAFSERGRVPATILDIGTGSGALLLAALHLWPQAAGHGIDRSLPALGVALANALRLIPFAPGLTLTQRDWTGRGWTRWIRGRGPFDLILCNPPYVEVDAVLAPSVRDHEPAGALFAGADGLDAYRRLLPHFPGLLATGGMALVEIGATQAVAVTALAQAAGLTAKLHRDLANRPRALELRQRWPL